MIKAIFFGRVPYLKGLQIQNSYFEKVKHIPNCHYLCLFEHDPTYTVGRRSQLYATEEEQRLRDLGAEFHRIKRGGLITFHGPGQLVAYPVFNLRSLRVSSSEKGGADSVGVRRFVYLVEETVLRLLSDHFALKNVGRTEDTGVWVDENRKLAALGIQVQTGITSHGLALNCDVDLQWFGHIVPCGLEGKSATSISQELGHRVSVEDVLRPICDQFQSVFQLPVQYFHHFELDP